MTFALAVPNKGRMKDPTVALLRDAGLRFETTDRALSVPVRNVDMELLFVRTDDIAELVSDGVATAGITGVDLLAEHGNGLHTVVDLGYGHCRLAAAVPNQSAVAKLEDFDGLRVATAHPNATGRFFADRNIDVSVIALRGSVEVATKIGVADAIVDLVSTGSTLRVNGLREVGTVIDSQAVLICRAAEANSDPIQQVATAMRAVVAGRNKRYLLLNAERTATATIVSLIPGLNSPTVVPLADSEMVAIHSVVDAAEMWSLLPMLEQAGASGILVLPIEQLIP